MIVDAAGFRLFHKNRLTGKVFSLKIVRCAAQRGYKCVLARDGAVSGE